jgi:hypothetical protein
MHLLCCRAIHKKSLPRSRAVRAHAQPRASRPCSPGVSQGISLQTGRRTSQRAAAAAGRRTARRRAPAEQAPPSKRPSASAPSRRSSLGAAWVELRHYRSARPGPRHRLRRRRQVRSLPRLARVLRSASSAGSAPPAWQTGSFQGGEQHPSQQHGGGGGGGGDGGRGPGSAAAALHRCRRQQVLHWHGRGAHRRAAAAPRPPATAACPTPWGAPLAAAGRPRPGWATARVRVVSRLSLRASSQAARCPPHSSLQQRAT